MKDKKKVYVGMAGDIIHHGHINLLTEASKYGKVIVGLLNDSAIESYKRKPINAFIYRKIVIENIKLVSEVVEQTTLDYRPNLRKYKPEFVVHGDDWLKGPQKHVRLQIQEQIKEWDGQIIDVPYTKYISTTDIINQLKNYDNGRISDE